jgi:putative CocE/NonD family hydrolase
MDVHGVIEVVRERGIVAEMADGVRLVADAWHPSGIGPWPVLLQRLPYGRSVASSPVLPSPTQLARRGYAVVVQDVRGRGDSEGIFEPFVHEAADGAATIEWAGRLPFCDGDVVTYGYSYQGFIQLLAAARRPAHLRAIAPMMCGSEAYEGWTYQGGCLQWSFVATWASQLRAQEPGAQPRPADLDALPVITALGPAPPPWFADWLGHPVPDEYWARLRPDLSAIDVPVFTVVGYFDQLAAGTARMVEAVGADAVFGPWPHMPWGTRLGDVELGEQATSAVAIEAFLTFVARVLRPGGAPRSPAVRWFSLGGGWRSGGSWPPASMARRWTATSAGGANSRHGDGRLVPGVADPGPPDVLVSEPLAAHPGDIDPLGSVAAGEDRRDVLCYTSAPFDAPLDLGGTAVATIVARADCPTFDVIASLVMVDAAGEARRLATGAKRVAGGEANELAIPIGPVAWLAPPGHRVRLDLSASRFPAIDRNPQSAELPAAATPRDGHRVATIEVLSATVDLPVVGDHPDAG